MLPRLGFVGCGWIGRKRLDALVKLGAAGIMGVVEPDKNATAELLRTTPTASIYGSYDELLAAQPDGIVISTPNYLHANQAERALLNGIPVFCQKPIGLTAKETGRVISAAKKANRSITTDFCYRSTACISRIANLISSGELGQLYFIDLVFHNSYGPDKNWYYSNEKAGGGCLLDLGIHLVDLALWMTGCRSVKGCSSRLYARGRKLDSRSTLEDHAIASLDLWNGPHLSVNCSWWQRLGGDATIRATFHGSAGLAVFENIDGSFYDFRAFASRNGARHTLAEPPDDWEGRAIATWAASIAQDKSFNAEAFELVSVAEVLDLIYESAELSTDA